MRTILFFFLFSLLCCKNASEKETANIVVTGLDGTLYHSPDYTQDELLKLDQNIEMARKAYDSDPTEENCIWVGRRLAYKMLLIEAVNHYTDCLKSYPQSYKILRHRGHRYISLRQYKKAIDDLTQAASLLAGKPIEIEPDGIPNKLNKPLSSIQFNIWYHLGLAHFLKGDFDIAAVAYEECLKYSDNDDLYAATADWLYMTYRRLKRDEQALKLLEKIQPEMNIIENDAYHRRLLMYKGILSPDDLMQTTDDENDKALQMATQGFGLGHWYLVQGDTVKAISIFRQVKESDSFTAFGFIAAEAELLRLAK